MRKLVFVLCILFLSFSSFGQPFQLKLFGGIANYRGDLIDGIYVAKMTRPAFGLSLGYEFTDRITLRGGLTIAKVAGSDKYNDKDYLKPRNLSFESSVVEGSLTGEYNFFNLYDTRWTPYVFGGVAVFHYNPYIYDANGDKIYLRPLSTEGQGLSQYPDRKPYSLTQLAIPVGGGIKYALTENIHIGAEVSLRKLFTDYLDDISTDYADENDLLNERGPLAVELAYRGDEVPGGDVNYPEKGAQRGSPKYKDLYYFTGLTLAFRLGGNGGRLFRGSRKGYGCPANPM